MNDIPTTQNEERQLERLAAQRQLYSEAKRHQACLIAAVIISALAAFLSPFWVKFQTWAAIFGVVIMLYELFFAVPAQNGLRSRAAKIQELFDCDVLQLPWQESAAGRKPLPEEVREAFLRYQNREPTLGSLIDWYPIDVGMLPLYLARLICQRASCRWDGSIRRVVARGFLATALLAVAIAAMVGFSKGMTLSSFLLGVMVPLLPTVLLGFKQNKEQEEAAVSVDQLREHLEDIWNQGLENLSSEAQITAASRELQTEIFHHRSKSPFVFDWVYKRLRNVHEDQMNVGARDYLERARKKLGLPPSIS